MRRPILYIGNKNYSSWSMRAWLVAKKSGIGFDEHCISLGIESKAKVGLVSPTAKVPVWVDQHTTVWDSLAICEYLAEQAPHLWPVDAVARAEARSISAEMHSGFNGLRSECSMNACANRRDILLSDAIKSDVTRLDQMWGGLRERYGDQGSWLFGSFSIADAMFAPVVVRLCAYQIPLTSNLKQYVSTWRQDADFRAWIIAAQHEQQHNNTHLEAFEQGRFVHDEPLSLDAYLVGHTDQ